MGELRSLTAAQNYDGLIALLRTLPSHPLYGLYILYCKEYLSSHLEDITLSAIYQTKPSQGYLSPEQHPEAWAIDDPLIYPEGQTRAVTGLRRWADVFFECDRYPQHSMRAPLQFWVIHHTKIPAAMHLFSTQNVLESEVRSEITEMRKTLHLISGLPVEDQNKAIATLHKKLKAHVRMTEPTNPMAFVKYFSALPGQRPFE